MNEKNKYSRNGQETKLSKSHITPLVSSVHLYENNPIMDINRLFLKIYLNAQWSSKRHVKTFCRFSKLDSGFLY